MNRPSTKQLLNNSLGQFLEKLKEFSGRGTKWIFYLKKGVSVKCIGSKQNCHLQFYFHQNTPTTVVLLHGKT